MTDLRFPIGPCSKETGLSEARRKELISQIADAPAQLRNAVRGLTAEQLDTPYRPGGWTLRQVAHHLPDSHLNAYARFKLALTEESPTVKTYDEAKWAELNDAREGPVEVSLDLLDALHRRWVPALASLSPSEYERKYQHPEMGLVTLERLLCTYAWHGRHHVAHITSLRERMGW